VASGTVVKEASHLDHDTRISILITGDLLLYFRKCSILLLQINKKMVLPVPARTGMSDGALPHDMLGKAGMEADGG
jgi:hypothetical protein